VIIKEEDGEQKVEYARTALTGRQLKRATLDFDPTTYEPIVSLEFNDDGKKIFADLTQKNVGKQLAIFLDGVPISIPVVREPILNGKAIISGRFTVEEAKKLAQRLNAGALPVPITLISQETIGASLGQEFLQKSLKAGLIGLILIALFMLAFYRIKGFVAIIALLIYGLLVLGIFKAIPVTLTLAGIAGFILSLGMAVDANVLIFERMKEEERIEDAFSRAWPAIRDGNISTLFTCLILYLFTTSMMKGFAVTLGIGVLVSMFSAMIVTRVFLEILSLRPQKSKMQIKS
jgi:protein-export membrane protein SecD